jgi:hypothetical protein
MDCISLICFSVMSSMFIKYSVVVIVVVCMIVM